MKDFIKILLIGFVALVLFYILGGYIANAKTIKIAVIDTGFDFNGTWADKPVLCSTGHKDFTKTGLNDNHGHGTHVAGIIGKFAGKADYCLVIIKFYDPKSLIKPTISSSLAIDYAASLGVDIINLSMGGVYPIESERRVILKALDNKIIVVAAAGNEGKSFSKQGYYPALYHKDIVVVSAVDSKGKLLNSSNYGKETDLYIEGKSIISILPRNSRGPMTGTSQATAKVSGIFASYMYKKLIRRGK